MLNPANVRLLRLREVLDIMQVSRSSWYQGMADDRYPRPIKWGGSSRWIEAEIYGLIEGARKKRNANSTSSYERFSG